MTPSFRVIAVIAAYNEEDIIEACLEHLLEQGVDAYLLDDGSTDATVERAERFRGRGLIDIEQLPGIGPRTFSLERILARKESLARELEAQWFINHDADEFRESPWAELNLRGAIERVDGLGWTAIDFEIFNIRPHGNSEARVAPSDTDVRYEPGAAHDRPQVRAWKKQAGPLDLRTSGGHDVAFEGRRVFPIPFPMRHYPVRSAEHGRRKIFQERRPRFDSAERARGWHVQYEDATAQSLIASSSALTPYDSTDARIRCALANRDLDAAKARLEPLTAALAVLTEQATRAEEERRSLGERLGTVEHDRSRLAGDVGRLESVVTGLDAEVHRLRDEVLRLEGGTRRLAADLAQVYASRSWRWTWPLRALARPLLERSR